MFLSTLMVLAVSTGAVSAENLTHRSADLTPCYVEGSEKALECTMLSVPESYSRKGSDSVDIHVIRARSFANTDKAPLFVLAGGPGQAATELTYVLERELKHIKKLHDIVFVDQRGSGLSNGQRCSGTDVSSYEALKVAFAECRKDIANLEEQLSTHTLAFDLESVRKALGYDKISLWGGSYGTFAAQHYATQYPDQVESMILDAALAIDGNPLVAGNGYPQQSLDRLDEICQRDEDCRTLFPQWKLHFYELLEQAENKPLALEDGTLDAVSLAHAVRTILYSAKASAKLPMAIESAHKGDMRLLNALNKMIGGAATDSMYVGLTMGVLCQEHVFAGQSQAAEVAGANSFTKDSYYTFWRDICEGERASRASYLQRPEALSMSTLVISGTLDPITPEQSAEKALTYLTNAQHIVIPNAGHVNSGLGCMPRLLAEFLNDGEVEDTSCISKNQFPPFMK